MQTDVLVAILALIFTDIAIHTAGTDVKQFMNQFQPLWTSRTTRRGPIQCEVDRLESVSPLSLKFSRCVLIGGRRCTMGIVGVLDTQRTERMTLFHRDMFRRVESLLYMGFDHSCAIIKVESLTQWDHIYYDLRVRNSSVNTRPLPVCRSYFKRVTRNQPSFNVYNPECQRLI
uniref:Lipocalin n=1 Tax=Rhipicephalus appendiculatus TaxID=34631 RepID=A0A131Z174_RHIAP